MSRRKKPRPTILDQIDFAAIPDLAKVWRVTNQKFPDPKRKKKVTLTVPEGLLYLTHPGCYSHPPTCRSMMMLSRRFAHRHPNFENFVRHVFRCVPVGFEELDFFFLCLAVV